MRSKTDESDERFRRLEAECKASKDELARAQQPAASAHKQDADTTPGAVASDERVQALKEEVAGLEKARDRAKVDWEQSQSVLAGMKQEIALKDSVIRDLQVCRCRCRCRCRHLGLITPKPFATVNKIKFGSPTCQKMRIA